MHNFLPDLAQIQQQRPIIHNISNYVAMEFNANALLAINASPIMAHAEAELVELLNLANALVINIGTLDTSWISAMHTALNATNNFPKIPIILDPVGAGASSLRTKTALDLLASEKISVLRGNAAEILALAGSEIKSHGIDSIYQTDSAISAAKKLAKKFKCTVVVSGANDIIANTLTTTTIEGGHPIMTQVTGMGCTASCLIGAFCAVNNNHFSATTHAMTLMKRTAEKALKTTCRPGTFKITFIDELFNYAEQANATT